MGGQSKVLVIEDDKHVRLVLEYNLRLDGFDVYLAEDGPTGLRLAREIVPEVILLDWMMPGMDGLAVLSELKHDEKMKQCRVFMLTAKGVPADVELALTVGADGYVVKPFNPRSLAQTIKQKLEKTQTAGQ